MPPVASPAAMVAEACRFVFVVLRTLVITVPPIGVSVSPEAAEGASVSMVMALAPAMLEAPAGSVVEVMALPAASVMVPAAKE